MQLQAYQYQAITRAKAESLQDHEWTSIGDTTIELTLVQLVS
jgi:hypothetical protein